MNDSNGDNILPTCDQHDRQIMTVGQLRDIIAGLDDMTQVVIDNTTMRGVTDGWYTNIAFYCRPDELTAALTLFGGAEVDSRQW